VAAADRLDDSFLYSCSVHLLLCYVSFGRGSWIDSGLFCDSIGELASLEVFEATNCSIDLSALLAMTVQDIAILYKNTSKPYHLTKSTPNSTQYH